MADLQISVNMEQAASLYDSAVVNEFDYSNDDYYFMWEWLVVEDFPTHFGYVIH